MTTITDDDLFNIMLYSDIDTITNICLTRTISYCSDEYFWKLKFNQNHLPILTKTLPTTLKGWRHEYMRVDEAIAKTGEMIMLLKNNDVTFYYTSEEFNFKNILPLSLRAAMYHFNPRYQLFTTLSIKYDDTAYKSNYRVVILGPDRLYHGFDIKLDDLYDVLAIIFYHYPSISYNIRYVG